MPETTITITAKHKNIIFVEVVEQILEELESLPEDNELHGLLILLPENVRAETEKVLRSSAIPGEEVFLYERFYAQSIESNQSRNDEAILRIEVFTNGYRSEPEMANELVQLVAAMGLEDIRIMIDSEWDEG